MMYDIENKVRVSITNPDNAKRGNNARTPKQIRNKNFERNEEITIRASIINPDSVNNHSSYSKPNLSEDINHDNLVYTSDSKEDLVAKEKEIELGHYKYNYKILEDKYNDLKSKYDKLINDNETLENFDDSIDVKMINSLLYILKEVYNNNINPNIQVNVVNDDGSESVYLVTKDEVDEDIDEDDIDLNENEEDDSNDIINTIDENNNVESI